MVAITFFFLSVSSQTTNELEKECRISSGVGIAGAAKHTISVERDFWLQLDYKFLKNISVAFEFENMAYQLPGYCEDLSINLNDMKVVNNDFSLLLKYHFATKSKIKLLIASGWTYSAISNDYYIFQSGNDNGTPYSSYAKNISDYSDYRITFLAEIQYPFARNLNLEVLVKYSLNPQNGNTYSGGLGLSLKL